MKENGNVLNATELHNPITEPLIIEHLNCGWFKLRCTGKYKWDVEDLVQKNTIQNISLIFCVLINADVIIFRHIRLNKVYGSFHLLFCTFFIWLPQNLKAHMWLTLILPDSIAEEIERGVGERVPCIREQQRRGDGEQKTV